VVPRCWYQPGPWPNWKKHLDMVTLSLSPHERKLCKTCAQCGKAIIAPKHPNRKYCSRACFDVAQCGSGTIPCEVCGNPFRRENVAQKYCSKACYGASRRVRPVVERADACLTCGGPLPWYSVKYCSMKCYARSQRHSPETRIKVCEQCGTHYEINT
jgi:hypothetical protein